MKDGQKTLLRVVVFGFLAFYAGNRWAMLAELTPDPHFGPLLSLFSENIFLWVVDALVYPFRISTSTFAMLTGTLCSMIAITATTFHIDTKPSRRTGEEYGSGRRGDPEELKIFADTKNYTNNVILSKNVCLAITKTDAVQESIPNLNIIVYGPPGTGKTTRYVEPNILNLIGPDGKAVQRDIVVTDPKGTMLGRTAFELVKAGADIVVFNTVNKNQSLYFNPLVNVKTNNEITQFARSLSDNTTEGRRSSEPIWDDGPVMLLVACLLLMRDYFPPEEYTLSTLLWLASLCEVNSDDLNAKCTLDYLFDQIETGKKWVYVGRSTAIDENDPYATSPTSNMVQVDSEFVRRDGVKPAESRKSNGMPGLDRTQDAALDAWKRFRTAPKRTLLSFVISLNSRFAYINTPEVMELMGGGSRGRDDMHLELLGQTHDAMGNPLRPRVVFVVSSDNDLTLSALMSIFMWQALRAPVNAADEGHNGRLPRPVLFLLDEFRNIGKIAQFPEFMTTVRSRGLGLQIVLQSYNQLKERYDQGAETIADGAATRIMLGGARSQSTAKEIEKEMGVETIAVDDYSTRGAGMAAEITTSTHLMGRPTFDANEIATLPSDEAILIVGSKHETKDKKAAVWEHANYNEQYMFDPGREYPESFVKKTFDFKAWCDAGKPFEQDAIAWEKAYYEGGEAELREEERIANERYEKALAYQIQARIHEGETRDHLKEVLLAMKAGEASALDYTRANSAWADAQEQFTRFESGIPILKAQADLAHAKAQTGLWHTLHALKRYDNEEEFKRVQVALEREVTKKKAEVEKMIEDTKNAKKEGGHAKA